MTSRRAAESRAPCTKSEVNSFFKMCSGFADKKPREEKYSKGPGGPPKKEYYPGEKYGRYERY